MSLLDRVLDWDRRVRDRPVTPRLDRDAIRARLARYDLSRPHHLDEIVGEIADLLEQGTLHATHPRYFGLFVPGVRRAGVIAETMAAAYNPQLASTWHAPAASEIERVALDYLLGRLGMDPAEAAASFTTGGSEANLTGVLAALTRAFPRVADEGLGALPRPPVFYGSDQAHASFAKVAQTAGLGRNAFRRAPSDERQRFDVGELRRAIVRDRAEGRAPFLVVATVGTTATGAIDPLSELADLCRDEDLWLHADAAWGGGAVLSETLRPHVADLARADSITWDAHKALPVPMGAGMFFCRHRRFAEAPFAVQTGYVPHEEPGTVDLYQRTIQWSRRFIGLKVFLTLAELGSAGVAALIDRQAAMGQLLRRELAEAGWRVVNDSPLPVVCFTADGVRPAEVARAVAAEGAAWISDVRLPGGAHWLRACVTNHDTGPEDVSALIAALDRARRGLRASGFRPQPE